jgi:hypothetical protein
MMQKEDVRPVRGFGLRLMNNFRTTYKGLVGLC